MKIRYKLFTDKIINMLAHSSQRGRGHILWLQSLISPLKSANDSLLTFADEKIIEANVSSQVIHFEWYLNYRFQEFFVDPEAKFKLVHYVDLGVPTFSDGEIGEVPNVIYSTTEDWELETEEEQPKPYYFEYESLSAIGASFRVLVPEINIPEAEFNIMLKATIDRYRISGKTYIIQNT